MVKFILKGATSRGQFKMKTSPLILASFIITLLVWLLVSLLYIIYPESLAYVSVTYMMYGATTMATFYLYSKLKFAQATPNRILFTIGLLFLLIIAATYFLFLSTQADFPSWIIVFHLPLYLLYTISILLAINRIGELLNLKREMTTSNKANL